MSLMEPDAYLSHLVETAIAAAKEAEDEWTRQCLQSHRFNRPAYKAAHKRWVDASRALVDAKRIAYGLPALHRATD